MSQRNFNFQFIQTDMLYRNGWGVKFSSIFKSSDCKN